MQFKIDKIEAENSWVTFTFDNGVTSSQTIANLPVEDEAALKAYLSDYADAYLAGLDVETQKTIPSPADIVGKVFEA